MRNTKDWYLFLDRMQRHGKRLYLYLDRKFYMADDALISGIKAMSEQLNDQEQISYRLQKIRKRLENGGLEKAAAGQLLRHISCIVVHEWQLEIRFDSQQTVFVKYPFPPDTERGRMMDRVRILECLQDNGNQTVGDLAGRLGRTRGIVWSRIRELKRLGCLRFEGRGGHGCWKVLKSLPSPWEQEE